MQNKLFKLPAVHASIFVLFVSPNTYHPIHRQISVCLTQARNTNEVFEELFIFQKTEDMNDADYHSFITDSLLLKLFSGVSQSMWSEDPDTGIQTKNKQKAFYNKYKGLEIQRKEGQPRISSWDKQGCTRGGCGSGGRTGYVLLLLIRRLVLWSLVASVCMPK